MEQRYSETKLFRIQLGLLYGGIVLLVATRCTLLMAGWTGKLFSMLLVTVLSAACLFFLLSIEKVFKIRDPMLLHNSHAVLFTLAALYGFTLLTNTKKSLLWLIVFVLLFREMKKFMECRSTKRIRKAACFLALFFAMAVLFGSEADRYDSIILWNTNDYTIHDIVLQIFAFIGIFLFFTICLNWGFARLTELQPNPAEQQISPRAFFSYWGGILVMWLPYYIAFYPGILDKDSLNEVAQQLGLELLSNHHPIIHQFIIGICMKIGLFIGSRNLGIGIYTAAQAVLMSAVFAFCLLRLRQRGTGKRRRIAIFLFYSVFTVNSFFVITMWKDVLFGGLSLLLSILLLDQISGRSKFTWQNFLILLAVSFLFSTMRNNGYYAFILGMTGMIVFDKRSRKTAGILLAAVVILVSAYHHVLFDIMGVKKSRTAEALSVPIQQIARVVIFSDVDLEDENFTILREVFPDIEELREDYIPIISDGVKHENVFESEIFDTNPMRYARAWASIGLQHPRAYMEAFLLQNYGYWYPDVDYTIIYPGLRENDLGLHTVESLEPLRASLRELTYELSKNQPTAILYSVGLIAWILLFCGTALFLKGFRRECIPMMILAGLWITTLASPVFCEYRYIYGLATCAPLYVMLALEGEKTNDYI